MTRGAIARGSFDKADGGAVSAEPEFRAFLCDIRDAGVRVMVGSDAHQISAVGEVDAAFALLAELGFPPGQIWTPQSES